MRIIFNNSLELDRINFTRFNDNGTVIYFMTQEPIPAGQDSGTSYYAYYSNSAAGQPPSNINNIFKFSDSFDKTVQSGNQTWTFNYITAGKQFTGMPSLLQVLNIWENQSLIQGEITNKVETFINSSKY